MRKPRIKNKYNLVPKDITKAIILDYDRLHKPPFWRNNNIDAWCIYDNTAKSSGDSEFGTYNDYWIGFYDDGARAYAGKIRLQCSAYGGMCNYNFKKFFDYREIEHEIDLEIQEKLLERINWMIDEKIIKIPKKG